MARKLDYRWHLRQVMASRGMFSTTDLIPPLGARGIRLSSSQVYRLVVDRPERLSLKVLMALLDILDCSISELIEPVAGGQPPGRRPRAAKQPASVWGSCAPNARASPPCTVEACRRPSLLMWLSWSSTSRRPWMLPW